jgi:effector-binding domain-containing protein
MKPKKYKFNIIVNKVEESYTGIFENYDLAIKWYEKHGKWLIDQGKNLVFRECLINGETNPEELPKITSSS